jgi:hypothetical protein
MEALTQEIRNIIVSEPAENQVQLFEDVITMALTELFNDSVAPRYGISKAEANSALASVKIKAKNI